jgi:membrane protein YqaA with SNARE-associated domain
VEPSLSLPPKPSAYRRFYERVVGLASSRHAVWALVAVSFADASFFPIPPFALLVPMIAAKPRRWVWLATAGTVASFVGGILGYYLGGLLHAGVISFLHIDLNLRVHAPALGIESTLGQLLGQNFWILTLLCSVLPTPFKVVSIGSGLVSVPFASFLLAAAIGRAARFFLVSVPVAVLAIRARRARPPSRESAKSAEQVS